MMSFAKIELGLIFHESVQKSPKVCQQVHVQYSSNKTRHAG